MDAGTAMGSTIGIALLFLAIGLGLGSAIGYCNGRLHETDERSSEEFTKRQDVLFTPPREIQEKFKAGLEAQVR